MKGLAAATVSVEEEEEEEEEKGRTEKNHHRRPKFTKLSLSLLIPPFSSPEVQIREILRFIMKKAAMAQRGGQHGLTQKESVATFFGLE